MNQFNKKPDTVQKGFPPKWPGQSILQLHQNQFIMKFYLTVLSLLVIFTYLPAQSPGSFASKLYRINNVELSSLDGFPLKGTMYSSTESAPGVLLLHVMGVGQRFDYEALATQLCTQGFQVFAIDLRAHGESIVEGNFEYTNQTLAEDIDVALAYLKSQPNVQPDLAVVGASGTVAEAVGLARRSTEVKAVVGISGHADESGKDYIQANQSLALLGVGAYTDSLMTKVEGEWKLQNSVETMGHLVKLSANPSSQMIAFDEAPHGTLMLGAKPKLIPQIMLWLMEVL